jgi:hypothetical protein
VDDELPPEYLTAASAPWAVVRGRLHGTALSSVGWSFREVQDRNEYYGVRCVWKI